MNPPSPELAALKARFIAGLAARLQRMQALLANVHNATDAKVLQREAHSLVGAAGIHGLEALANAAASLNQALVKQLPADTLGNCLLHLADRIREVATPAPPDKVGQAGNRARVAVICQGDDERASLCSLLHDADFTVDAWPDPAAATSHHPPTQAPDVLVLSLQFGEGTDAGLQAIETARRHWPGAPVLVTTAHRDLDTRLAALRAGAAGVMVKPFAAEELLQRIGQLRVGDPPPAPVVVVEPGGNQPDAEASEARTWPAHWQVVHSIAALSAALERHTVAAVVLNGGLAEATPTELTTLLQDGPCCARLPVVWFTPRPDAALHMLAAKVGAAAVVDAELPLPVLTAVVDQHTRRAHTQHDRMQRLQHALYELNRQRMALDQHATVSLANAQGVVIDTSPQHVALTGHAIEQLIGAHLCEPRPGKAAPELPATALQIAKEAGLWRGRVQLTRADLAPCWVDATLVPFVNPQGEVYRYLLARSNVTQQVTDALAIDRLRQSELDTASTIQSTLLVPPLPHCPAGVSVAARFRASGGVAGDFHELLELRPGVFDVLLGDVMGKGVAAGLIGAAVKLELARCLSDLGAHTVGELAQPAAIVRALHQRLTPRLMALDTYVTLSYLRIEPEHQRLTSVGCGHPQTLVVHDGVALPLSNNNLPLGVLPDDHYEQSEHLLPPGATVVMYSDGLTEATDAKGHAFGPQRLALAACELAQGHADARLTADGLLAQVHAHVQGNPADGTYAAGSLGSAQTDDQTLVVLRIPNNGEHLASLPRSLDALTSLRHTLATCEPLLAASDATRDRLCLAAVEAFSNTVRHGHATTDDTTISLAITRQQGAFTLELTDMGTPFFPPDDPSQPDPLCGAEGGYGLSLIKTACDDVRYTHQQGINRCRLGVLPDTTPEFAMSSQ